MALFQYHEPAGNGRRLTGIWRYQELLERGFKRFVTVNLLTLLGFLPFLLGTIYAVLTSSILILIPVCIIGGAVAGPFLACMYDTIFRSLRDAPGSCMENYRRAFRQNWRQAVIPGIVFCLLLGFYTFMLMMLLWAYRFPGWGTIAVYVCGILFFTMFFTIYWPQLVLFEQTGIQRFKNCLLFLIRFFWRVFGCALIQIVYWAVILLFLPWSVILLPFLGVWFILYTADFLLYDTFNEVFHIEEEIAHAFPEQAAFYEDDESWLKRKQAERHQEN